MIGEDLIVSRPGISSQGLLTLFGRWPMNTKTKIKVHHFIICRRSLVLPTYL